nr:immunoglobulin heavy chain junction region [Macaca mulatta]MOY22519.1 immunoglobulin heavy chain junction region [Macaca mulatta]MOY22930.1 immunoglobulin heavy chain junction region [Macaca mulatta]MOY23154.1 immunoglobulin heavy chain junction region [Macaca mulatta]MOY23328.1 immunoglobulin heavy chain junction region [Macaca mulatta]
CARVVPYYYSGTSGGSFDVW